jgi:hypothetical protein
MPHGLCLNAHLTQEALRHAAHGYDGRLVIHRHELLEQRAPARHLGTRRRTIGQPFARLMWMKCKRVPKNDFSGVQPKTFELGPDDRGGRLVGAVRRKLVDLSSRTLLKRRPAPRNNGLPSR